MPTPRRKRVILPARIRALEVLEGRGDAGGAEGLMSAHGFTIPDMVELVRAGLATATVEQSKR
jgi:hypothetical protein